MNKLKILVFSILFIIISTPLYAQGDAVLDYVSDIRVNTDTTTQISEIITFQPSTEVERHGLEWTYPYIYSVNLFRKPTELDINSVRYYPLDYPTQITIGNYTRTDSNGWANLRIGNANILITTPHIYEIDYTLKYTGVSYFDTHDEFYLNIIGPGWNLPIYKASATITMPNDITEAICYTGAEDSTEQFCEYEIKGNVLTVKPTTMLDPYEGYTIAIKQPKGTFLDTRKEQREEFLISNILILLPIPVGIFLFVFLKRKTSNKKLTVIPQYKPPENLDVLSSAILIKNGGRFNSKYISSLLIECAIKGYFTIREYKKEKFELVRSEVDFTSEPKHINDLLTAIFVHGTSVKLNQLTNFYYNSTSCYSESKKHLFNLEYFFKKKTDLKSFLNLIIVILGVFTMSYFSEWVAMSSIGTAIGVVGSLIFLIYFVSKMDLKSELGNEVYHQLLGLKMYIQTAEADRIKFHNDPDKYKERFEKLLPYAMIFGLEKKWAELFEDIYTTPPSWYEGMNGNFSSIYFINSMSRFNRNFVASASPQHSYGSSGGFRSSGWSSGGSGFGGGGSSGGGGGGSGGGGW
jgi:uncharacterized membrane protein YgcG